MAFAANCRSKTKPVKRSIVTFSKTSRSFSNLLCEMSRDDSRYENNGPIVSDDEVLIAAGEKLTEDILQNIPLGEFRIDLRVEEDDGELEDYVFDVLDKVSEKSRLITVQHEEKKSRLSKGDELITWRHQMVVVYVAIKRKLQVGDKMAGRHGNKGVVSRIMPIESMPYLEDGTPVDVVSILSGFLLV